MPYLVTLALNPEDPRRSLFQQTFAVLDPKKLFSMNRDKHGDRLSLGTCWKVDHETYLKERQRNPFENTPFVLSHADNPIYHSPEGQVSVIITYIANDKKRQSMLISRENASRIASAEEENKLVEVIRSAWEFLDIISIDIYRHDGEMMKRIKAPFGK